MSFVEFGKDLNTGGLGPLVAHAFDELMVLYRMIGVRQDLEICTDNQDDGSVKFNLLTPSRKDAKKLIEEFHGTQIQVYGYTYEIHMNQHNSTVETTIDRIHGMEPEYKTIF